MQRAGPDEPAASRSQVRGASASGVTGHGASGVGDSMILPVGRLQRLMQKVWWLHSFGALAFGVGVMMFAREGLDHADKVLLVLLLSWILVFVAFRFIVGAANTSPGERRAKKGLRVVTNYVIKQLYQQMFFFLVPLYASSATWSLTSWNWWLVPILLTFAVISTMDLVFDNFVMERRVIASAMYGVCVFAVLNLNLPLVFRFSHFDALLASAGATAPTVALLGFRLKTVLSARGILITSAVAVAMVVAVYYGRVAIPPAPMAMAHGAIGHGAPGQYECVPGPLDTMPRDQLDLLRCVTHIVEPGGFNDEVVHVWRHEGAVVARVAPEPMPECEKVVLRSTLGGANLPADPRGRWSCTAETGDGQLIGRKTWRVVDAPAGEAASPVAPAPAGPAPSGPASSTPAPPKSAPSEPAPTSAPATSAPATSVPAPSAPAPSTAAPSTPAP
jgi:cell division septation protein DedD